MAIIPLRRVPAGVCDACGRWCCTLDQAGIPCYHCYAGTFVHRGKLLFSVCPTCDGADKACERCHNKGIVATPVGRLTD